jgi:hypothetical protein
MLDTKWGHIVTLIVYGSCFVWGYLAAVSYAPMEHTLISHILAGAMWAFLLGTVIWSSLFFFYDVIYIHLITKKGSSLNQVGLQTKQSMYLI